jgi:ubiquinone biosynthesis protein UbiJ
VSLLALSGPAPESVLQRGDVLIEGDAELAQKFRELARLLRPDLEEELSLVVGDVPAHQLGRLARLALGFGQRAARTTLMNLAEYLGHERADLVPRNEGEQFLSGVERLREGVDRLEARLKLLARRRGAR